MHVVCVAASEGTSPCSHRTLYHGTRYSSQSASKHYDTLSKKRSSWFWMSYSASPPRCIVGCEQTTQEYNHPLSVVHLSHCLVHGILVSSNTPLQQQKGTFGCRFDCYVT